MPTSRNTYTQWLRDRYGEVRAGRHRHLATPLREESEKSGFELIREIDVGLGPLEIHADSFAPIREGGCASGIPDTLLRNRMAVKVMGEVCGIAAALSAARDIAPKQLERRELQEALLDSGFYCRPPAGDP